MAVNTASKHGQIWGLQVLAPLHCLVVPMKCQQSVAPLYCLAAPWQCHRQHCVDSHCICTACCHSSHVQLTSRCVDCSADRIAQSGCSMAVWAVSIHEQVCIVVLASPTAWSGCTSAMLHSVATVYQHYTVWLQRYNIVVMVHSDHSMKVLGIAYSVALSNYHAALQDLTGTLNSSDKPLRTECMQQNLRCCSLSPGPRQACTVGALKQHGATT